MNLPFTAAREAVSAFFSRLFFSKTSLPRLAFSLCLILLFFALGWASASLMEVSSALQNASETLDQSRRAIRASRAAGAQARDWLEAENRRASTDSLSSHQNDLAVRFRFQISPTGKIKGIPSHEEHDTSQPPPFFANLSAADFHNAILKAEAEEMNRRSAAAAAHDPQTPRKTFHTSPKTYTFRPCWVSGELFLLRRLQTTQGDAIEGTLLDINSIATELALTAAPYFPNATFIPIFPGTRQAANAYPPLAVLPFALDATLAPASGVTVAGPTSVLLFCWLLAALAMLGIVMLYHGTASLGERRAAFVSAVTHELRTPLTAFRLHTELLAEGLIPPEKQPETFSILHNEADRLAHLVENVLGYARLEHGKSSFKAQSVRLQDLIEYVEPRILTRLKTANVEFSHEISPADNDAEVLTNTTAVEQILFNLADNAAKYAGTGHAAHLTASTQKGFAVIDFTDNGPGIPCNIRNSVFRPFFRSAEAAAGSQPGVGLGLAFSRQLAETLGGTLELLPPDPNSPTGTRFRLRLPTQKGN